MPDLQMTRAQRLICALLLTAMVLGMSDLIWTWAMILKLILVHS
jgi:hypothetical protein